MPLMELCKHLDASKKTTIVAMNNFPSKLGIVQPLVIPFIISHQPLGAI